MTVKTAKSEATSIKMIKMRNYDVGQRLLEALDLLQLLKKDFLQEMPLKVRSKASSQISRSSSAEIKSNPQIFHLLGRCFNLSINAKILSQCQFTDLAVAVRLLEDLETLENGLKFMSKDPKISLTNLTI